MTTRTKPATAKDLRPGDRVRSRGYETWQTVKLILSDHVFISDYGQWSWSDVTAEYWDWQPAPEPAKPRLKFSDLRDGMRVRFMGRPDDERNWYSNAKGDEVYTLIGLHDALFGLGNGHVIRNNKMASCFEAADDTPTASTSGGGALYAGTCGGESTNAPSNASGGEDKAERQRAYDAETREILHRAIAKDDVAVAAAMLAHDKAHPVMESAKAEAYLWRRENRRIFEESHDRIHSAAVGGWDRRGGR